MLRDLSASHFSPHVGEQFLFSVGSSEPLALELAEVSKPYPDRERPFSVVFRGAPDGGLGQGTYQVEHHGLGSFALFVVPIGPDKDGSHLLYEAVFN